MPITVDFLSVVHHPPDGSLHLIPVKSQEAGILEMMQTQEHNKSLDAPDGSYPLYVNSRTQDTSVEPSGTRSPPLATGVVQSAVVTALATCASLMVVRTSTVRRVRAVCVPSGV